MAAQDVSANNTEPGDRSTSTNPMGRWSAPHREELLHPNGRVNIQQNNSCVLQFTQDHQYAGKPTPEPSGPTLDSKLCSFALSDILPLLIRADFAGAFQAFCAFAIQLVANNYANGYDTCLPNTTPSFNHNVQAQFADSQAYNAFA